MLDHDDEVLMTGRSEVIVVPGLHDPVEVLMDRYGVPHIYASADEDLYLAQGFTVARDRLFQMDLWRRRGLGLLAEVLGEQYLARDRAARLFLYRGDMEQEWSAYGFDAKQVTTAFVTGINAFVAMCRVDERLLPPEFRELHYAPSMWLPEDVARIRSHGMYYNLEQEVARARVLRDFPPEVEDLRRVREPAVALAVPDGLDLSLIPDDVLAVYRLATTPVAYGAEVADPGPNLAQEGSNNWVIAADRSATGRPLLANDPHRAVTLPSLRYLCHLSAPGIDVIGAGEPILPGVSIGHNDRISFGFTILPIDQEDLYVYQTRPGAPTEFRYGDGYESMTEIVEEIPVRGLSAVPVTLRYTRHGPVIREDTDTATAFAVRAAWLLPGMAPYLGSVAYTRASTADEFVAALRQWGAPGENHVYATSDGTIGWQPAGRVPLRHGWNGTLPVPGDGRYEWDGFVDAVDLPSTRDPAQGWFASANEMNVPETYPHEDRAVSYDWYAPYRHDRLVEALAAHDEWTLEECVRLQTDYLSVPARSVLSTLTGLRSPDPSVQAALHLLSGWDAVERAGSGAAALFEVWYQRHLRPALLTAALRQLVPPADVARALAYVMSPEEESFDARTDLALLLCPGDRLGPDPGGTIAKVVMSSLARAVDEVEGLLGTDWHRWAWGDLHRAVLRHPMTLLMGDPDWAQVGPCPRGGSGDTVGNTSYDDDFTQRSGATFRVVVDVGDWDRSVAMNAPGQSGVPDSPHYADLFADWASDRAFPLLYSRAAVEAQLAHRFELRPPAEK